MPIISGFSRNVWRPTYSLSIYPARFFRLTVNTVRTAGSAVQLAEFRLRDGATNLTGMTYTNGNGSSPAGEGPANAGDSANFTKWQNNTGAGSILLITFATPVTVTAYSWTTANDATGEDMTGWTLSASKDNSTWVTIHTVSGLTATVGRGVTRNFTTTPGL